MSFRRPVSLDSLLTRGTRAIIIRGYGVLLVLVLASNLTLVGVEPETRGLAGPGSWLLAFCFVLKRNPGRLIVSPSRRVFEPLAKAHALRRYYYEYADEVCVAVLICDAISCRIS